MTRTEIRISGLGGQGVITTGFVLGQACLFDKKNATQTQSYGPEARGSVCRSEVVISNEEIDYPKVVKPDILLSMSQDAYVRYSKDIKKEGIIIIDSSLVDPGEVDPKINLYEILATETAVTVLGNGLVANVVMIGALIAITKVVSSSAMKKSIVNRWPRFTELNDKAFQKGMELGKAALKAHI